MSGLFSACVDLCVDVGDRERDNADDSQDCHCSHPAFQPSHDLDTAEGRARERWREPFEGEVSLGGLKEDHLNFGGEISSLDPNKSIESSDNHVSSAGAGRPQSQAVGY